MNTRRVVSGSRSLSQLSHIIIVPLTKRFSYVPFSPPLLPCIAHVTPISLSEAHLSIHPTICLLVFCQCPHPEIPKLTTAHPAWSISSFQFVIAALALVAFRSSLRDHLPPKYRRAATTVPYLTVAQNLCSALDIQHMGVRSLLSRKAFISDQATAQNCYQRQYHAMLNIVRLPRARSGRNLVA